MEQRKNYDKNKTHDFSFYNRFILEIETRIFLTPHLYFMRANMIYFSDF